jgi:NAD(P)-dependent dehydrogenase (short-subunit alcohol dehydrogenase family)
VTRPSALVVGGGSGIGAATCQALAADGFRVVVADLNLPAAEAVAAQVASGATALAVDVTAPESVSAMVAHATAGTGRLDAAVNCAGIAGPAKPVADYTDDEWHAVLAVNLHGVFHCMRAEIGVMREHGGAIVNIASVLGAVAAPAAPAYTTSKHAVVGLSRSAALDYAAAGIRVNAVGPGFVRTPLLVARADDDRLAALADRHPLGRLGEPEEIAALVAWLCGPSASFVTGAFLPVDGGYLAR